MASRLTELLVKYEKGLCDSEESTELLELLQAANEYKRYNKLEYMKPYDYQLEFMNASIKYKQRYLRAANRCGKTMGASIEFAMHLTGRYQDYYKGERFPSSGNVYWCIGIDLDSVSKVLQKELFGTADIRVESEIGTGTIPRDCIELEQGIVKDGPRLKSCFIKHTDGGYNTVHFYGSNNEASMMGQTIKMAWLDEEPEHNSMELYAQCLTRTLTTEGHIMFTATPEVGYTELNRMFDEDETGQLYVKSASWWDAPHITQEMIDKMLAGIPEYQRDMRSKGLPVIGTGAVFPYSEEEITESDIQVEGHWKVVAAIDIGHNVDPSVITFTAYDEENDKLYVYDEIYLDDDRSAKAIAEAIKGSSTPNIPVVVPGDGGLSDSSAPDTYGKQLRDVYGINVHPNVFRNPTCILLDPTKVNKSIETGLVEMRRRFSDGSLKVSSHCDNILREMRQYFYKPKGGRVKPTGEDHAIDSMRYSTMSALGFIGAPYAQVLNEGRFLNNGFYNDNTNNGFSY